MIANISKTKLKLFIISLLFLFSPEISQACSQLDSTKAIPAGFGAAYDFTTPGYQLSVKTTCDVSSLGLEVGNGLESQLIYKYGYIYRNGAWEKFTFSNASSDATNVWIKSKATGSIVLSTEEKLNTNYIVAYICNWTGTKWKCGCRDNVCATSFWQLQIFKYPTANTCVDNDKDGFDNCASGQSGDDGKAIDCDDNNKNVYLNAIETCDAVDNNCNGQIDEGCDSDRDGYCNKTMKIYKNTLMCQKTIFTGNGMSGNDCNDSNLNIHPDATEVCDGIDNNCNGVVDENCACTNGATKSCGSNIGVCKYGTQTCVNGTWGTCVGGVNPTTEICGNNIDEDCNGSDLVCSPGGGIIPQITTISGDSKDGNILSLAGNNFGSKIISSPMKFENFENGVDGQIIAGDNAFGSKSCDDCWSDYSALKNSGTEDPKYSSINNRPGSKLNVREHYVINHTINPTTDFSDSTLVYEGKRDITDKVYTSFWIRWDWGVSADTAYQFKMLRIGVHDGFGGWPGIFCNNWHQTDGIHVDNYSVGLYTAPNVIMDLPKDLAVGPEGGNPPTGNRQWGQVQVWAKGDAVNGEVHLRYLNPSDNTVVTRDWKGPTITSGSWRDFIFGQTMANVEPPNNLDVNQFFDDIYIDDSWSRVEIGNNQNYNNCTHREMQIPQAWTNNSINFKFNKGSFNVGDNLYLFVIDGNGVVSQGYPITIN